MRSSWQELGAIAEERSPIRHSCGHVATHLISGTFWSRAQQRVELRFRRCPACVWGGQPKGHPPQFD